MNDPAVSTDTAPELTVVVPTFNEAANVPLVVERLDGGARRHRLGSRLRRRRFARRHRRGRAPALRARTAACGSSGGSAGAACRRACVEGVLSSSAPYFAVMDGDLQHDDTALPAMLATAQGRRSRYRRRQPLSRRRAHRRPASDWRRFISRAGGQVARLVLHADLTDPMSGFFVMSRAAFDDDGAQPVPAGLQDPARHLRLGAAAAALRRGAERISRARCTARASSTRMVGAGNSASSSSTSWSAATCRCASSCSPLVGATGIVVHLATLGLAGVLGARLRRGAVGRGGRRR